MQPVVACDYITRRILQLATPFVFLVLFDIVMDLVILTILEHGMGTADMMV